VKEYSAILKALKEVSIFDVFLVSFLLLPFIFEAWLTVLEKLKATDTTKLCSLAAVLIFYVIGVIAMLVGNSRSKKRAVAKDQIIAYLQSKQLTFVSFARIRERINQSYDDDFLESLTVAFPQELRRAKLKGNNRGIGRIVEETGDEA
jgi:hypothetical protein